MAKKVFISYRRADTEAIAGRLRDRLLTHLAPSHVFFDTGSIQGGELFPERIDWAARTFDTMVVMIGSGWLGPAVGANGRTRIWQADDFVRLEVRAGLERGAKMTILPVLVEDAEVPERADLPEDLQGLLAHNMMRLANATFDRDFEILLARTQGKASPSTRRGRPFRIAAMTAAGAALACFAALLAGIAHMVVFKRSLAISLGGNAAVELALILVIAVGAVAGYRVGGRR